MGFNLNKVILGGRITADPELKATQIGTSVTTFTIAVNRRYSSGEQQNTDFINVVAWRQNAEFVTRYFHKGSSICVVGSLQTRTWTDPHTNQKRYATEVVADEVMFVDNKSDNQTVTNSSYVPNAHAPTTAPKFEEIPPDEDLPF